MLCILCIISGTLLSLFTVSLCAEIPGDEGDFNVHPNNSTILYLTHLLKFVKQIHLMLILIIIKNMHQHKTPHIYAGFSAHSM